MSIILQEGKEYPNPFDNTKPLENPYGVIDRFETYNKATKEAVFVLEIYARECTGEERKSRVICPINTYTYRVDNEDFDEYFSIEAVNDDDNHYKRAYVYLLDLKELSEDGNEKWIWGDDWQSDED